MLRNVCRNVYNRVLQHPLDITLGSYLLYNFAKKDDATLIEHADVEKITIGNVDITDDIENSVQRIKQLSEKLDIKAGKIYISNDLLDDGGYVRGLNNDIVLGACYLLSKENMRRLVNDEYLHNKYDLNGEHFIKDRDFVLAHELSHIHYGDTRNYYVNLIMLLGSRAFCIIYSHSIYATIPLCVTAIFAIFNSKRIEKRADIKAVEILGEKESAIYCIKKFIKQNKHGSKTWRDHFIAENGNNYLDYSHPLLSTRLNYIKKLNIPSTPWTEAYHGRGPAKS